MPLAAPWTHRKGEGRESGRYSSAAWLKIVHITHINRGCHPLENSILLRMRVSVVAYVGVAG